jgi:aryl-alcohol dehydrogenase-like predicted oxidoreductase
MKYVNLGISGLKVSRIALGMMTFGTAEWRPWVIGEEAARPIVQRAIELGVNLFDTADMYSAGVSEQITGRLLRELAPCDEIVIATKLYFPVDLAFKGGNATAPKPAERPNMSGLSRKRILAAVDASLQRLGVDTIDLYQIHRFDPATPIEETMEALHDVVRAGKARYIGASSMWAWQFAKMQDVAQQHGWTRFVSMQNHYNLAYREEEREMIPLCRDQGVGLLPWSPLARGFLAGNRARDASAEKASGATSRAQTDDIAQKYYYQDADHAVAAALGKLTKQKGVSNATLAYAWLLHQPGVSAPIVGASKAWQIEQAVQALDVSLSAEELALLAAPYQPHPVLGHQ